MKKLEKDDLGFLIPGELLAILDDVNTSAEERIAVWEHVRGIREMAGFAGTLANGIKAAVTRMNNFRYARIEKHRADRRKGGKYAKETDIDINGGTLTEVETNGGNNNELSRVEMNRVETPKAPVGGSGEGLTRYSRKEKRVSGRGALEVVAITGRMSSGVFPNSADVEKVSRALCSVFNMRKPTGEYVYDPVEVENRIGSWLEYWKTLPSDKVPARLQDWIRAIGFMAEVPQKKNAAPEKETTAFEMAIA